MDCTLHYDAMLYRNTTLGGAQPATATINHVQSGCLQQLTHYQPLSAANKTVTSVATPRYTTSAACIVSKASAVLSICTNAQTMF